jgi:hypothetical protein
MPLPSHSEREELHHRTISMKVFRRTDGLYDVEAHLVDTKPFPFERVNQPAPLPPGQPLHDLWLRLVVDDQATVRAVEAASDTTPFDICPQAGASLSVLVGERIGRGWSKVVRERLPRIDNCTHLAELLLPLATTALMGLRGVRPLTVRFPPGERPSQLDSCYAWSAEREMVGQVWPQYSRKPVPGASPKEDAPHES